MKINLKKRIVHFIAPTVFLTMVLSVTCFLRYIDGSVVLAIYLPIWIIGSLATLSGKTIFADVVIIFAGIGLIAEYLIYLSNGFHPNMSGAFLNSTILIVGLILGAMLQIVSNVKLKTN